MRSIESRITPLSLAIIAAIGLTACSSKQERTPDNASPSPTITGEAAKVITAFICEDRYRGPDGVCRKGGIETRDVQVCSLTPTTVIILDPSGAQKEATIGGEAIGQVFPKSSDENFIPCL